MIVSHHIPRRYVCKGLEHAPAGDASQALCRAACCADKKKCGLYQWVDPNMPQGGCWLGWTNSCTSLEDLSETGRRKNPAVYWVGEGEAVHEPVILESAIILSDWGKFR